MASEMRRPTPGPQKGHSSQTEPPVGGWARPARSQRCVIQSVLSRNREDARLQGFFRCCPRDCKGGDTDAPPALGRKRVARRGSNNGGFMRDFQCFQGADPSGPTSAGASTPRGVVTAGRELAMQMKDNERKGKTMGLNYGNAERATRSPIRGYYDFRHQNGLGIGGGRIDRTLPPKKIPACHRCGRTMVAREKEWNCECGRRIPRIPSSR